MLIIDPKCFIDVQEETEVVITSIHTARVNNAVMWHKKDLSDELIDWASSNILELSGIFISSSVTKTLLDLYPFEKAIIGQSWFGDTANDEAMADIVANYFGATRWPIYKDQVDIVLFIKRLQNRARYMGFEVHKYKPFI